MKEIELCKYGKNKGMYVALVDDDDFEELNQFNWYANKSGNTFYAVRATKIGGKQFKLRMHCVVMNGKEIDHIDHNGLNNQKYNLRLCTHGENMMNRAKNMGTSSIYKGVCFYKPNGKWIAQITVNQKRRFHGYFVSEIDAARAYNKKAIELFGEFANINKFD